MNIAELIAELEQIRDEWGDEVEVRMAQQPSWPLEYTLDGVVEVETTSGEPDEDGHQDGFTLTVYLVEGDQIGYLPGAAVQACWG